MRRKHDLLRLVDLWGWGVSQIHEIASEALTYLAETDEDCAKAKAHMKGLEYKIKRVLAQQTLQATAKTAGERKCVAEASEAYQAITEGYESAVLDYELLATKRATQLARFEWARSMNANKRQGGGNL